MTKLTDRQNRAVKALQDKKSRGLQITERYTYTEVYKILAEFIKQGGELDDSDTWGIDLQPSNDIEALTYINNNNPGTFGGAKWLNNNVEHTAEFTKSLNVHTKKVTKNLI